MSRPVRSRIRRGHPPTRRATGAWTHWLPAALLAAVTPAAAQVDASRFAPMKARSIGPAGMSGRVGAIEVVPGDPNTIYVGGASGGVWRSTDGGTTWTPVFDEQPAASIGAIAAFPANPATVWVGTGEGNPRNSAGVGRGMFKSLDGGDTWRHVGLDASERIHRVVLHPTDPDIAYAAVLGPSWSDGPQRGVFRTRDGGATWERVLSGNPRTGAADLVIDPRNPNKLFAALWEHRRWPWFFESGGEGSGLFVTYDGGDTWRRYTEEDGLPAGPLGRIGLAIADNDPRVVYALVEAERSALLRSEDGGRSWRTIRSGPGTAPRPFYYADIRVDPTNENRLYSLHSRIEVSEDQGRTFRTVVPSDRIHGDVQDLWIGATGRLLVMGNDGGIGISLDRGETWRFVENLPLAQFYHINVDLAVPYNVYGGLQDNGSWFGPAAPWRAGPIRNYDWTRVGGGDGFATMTDHADARYGFTESQQGNLTRFDKLTGERKDVQPVHPDGVELRFNWNAALNVDPIDSTVIYLGSQFLHRSRDHGDSWEIISPDLTTNDPAKQRARESGGITRDASGAENHTTIMTIAPSPVERGVIWVGTDDGNVQITRDDGATWQNVSGRIPGVPAATWVPHIEPDKFQAGAAFVVLDDHRRGNWEPYVLRTEDYGRSWRSLVTEAIDGFVHVLEQDPVEPSLLFLGTEFGLYVSIDAGGHWTRWPHGLPTTPYRALIVHPRDHDLVIGTHGRAAFVLDDIRPLRALAGNRAIADADVHLFDPPPAYQHTVAEAMTDGYRSSGDAMFAGDNREYGALISYWSASGEGRRASIEIVDPSGSTVRTISHPARTGLNRLTWNLRTDNVPAPGARANGTMPGYEILPGRYTVRMTLAGTTVERPLDIRPDPRQGLSDGDRRAKDDALRQTSGYLAVAAELMVRIRQATRQLDAALEILDRGEPDDTLVTRGRELRGELQRMGEAVAGGGDDDDPVREPVGSRLQSVYRSLQTSWDAPTQSQRRNLAAAESALEDGLNGFNDLGSGAWTAFREAAAAAGAGGLDEIAPLQLDWSPSTR